MNHEQRLRLALQRFISDWVGEADCHDIVNGILTTIRNEPFPVRVEVRGGVAEETESSPCVLLTITDHDNDNP